MASFRALFQSLGLEMASPTSVDMRVVRAAYRRFLLAKHPDKCRHNEFEAEVKLVLADMRRYEAWRNLQHEFPPYTPVGRNSSPWPYSGDEPSSSTWTPAEDASALRRSPCSQQPHCSRFERSHGRKSQKRQCEYLFLYAATSRCVPCLKYYSQTPEFDTQCKSCGLTARQWARYYDKSAFSQELEDWLLSVGL